MGDTASAIAQAGQSGGTQMRVGTVVAFDTRNITVKVAGGTLVAMPYLQSYSPLLGDSVLCLNVSGVWCVVGTFAGSPPDNVAVNPSFENSGTGSMASGWGNYHDPSSTLPTAVTVQSWSGAGPVDGTQILEVLGSPPLGGGGHSSIDFTYSSPFPVNPGEKWAAAAYGRVDLAGAGDIINLQVLLTYYANNTNVYPNTSAAPSGGNGAYFFQEPAFVRIGPGDPTGIIIPGGAVYARLTLRTQIATNLVGGSGPFVSWDAVLARKVS